MNYIMWAAWGVVDIEALDRMQRRNYIKRCRAELALRYVKLDCGGSTANPHYIVTPLVAPSTGASLEAGGSVTQKAFGGVGSFKKACEHILNELGIGHERSEDGSVRGAGAEA